MTVALALILMHCASSPLIGYKKLKEIKNGNPRQYCLVGGHIDGPLWWELNGISLLSNGQTLFDNSASGMTFLIANVPPGKFQMQEAVLFFPGNSSLAASSHPIAIKEIQGDCNNGFIWLGEFHAKFEPGKGWLLVKAPDVERRAKIFEQLRKELGGTQWATLLH